MDERTKLSILKDITLRKAEMQHNVVEYIKERLGTYKFDEIPADLIKMYQGEIESENQVRAVIEIFGIILDRPGAISKPTDEELRAIRSKLEVVDARELIKKDGQGVN